MDRERAAEHKSISLIINNVSDIVMCCDALGNLTYANKAWKNTLGYNDLEDTLNINSIIMPEFSKYYNNICQSIKTEYITEDIRIALIKKSGKPIIAEGKAYTDRDGSGKITETIWILRELPIADSLLDLYRQDKSLLELYTNRSDVAYSVMLAEKPITWSDTSDKEAALDYLFKHSRTVMVNKAYLKLYNIKDENDVLNKTPSDLFYYDIDAGKETWRLLLDSGHQSFSPYEIFSGVQVEGFNNCIYNDAGQYIGHMTSMWVVFDEKEAQKQAVREQMLNKTSDFRLIKTESGSFRFPYVGSEFFEISGIEAEKDAESQKKLLYLADAEKVRAAFNNSSKDMTFLEIEFRIIHPTKGLRWLKAIAHPEKLPDKSVMWQGYLSDITNRKQSSEWIEFLNTALMNINDCVIITDSNGDIIYANKSAVSLHGYSEDELMGQKLDIFLVDDVEEGALEDMFTVLSDGKTYVIESLSKKKDGSVFISENSTTAIFDENEHISAYVLIQRDITEKRKMLEALKNSNERFEQLTKQSRAIAWETDESFIFTYINNAVYDVLGYPPESMVDKTCLFDLISPYKKQACMQEILEAADAKKPFNNLTIPVVTKNGKELWLSTNGIPIYGVDGSIEGYSGLSVDITDKIQMEQIINNEKERYRATLLSVGDGIISTDNRGNIDVMNPIAEKLTGWMQNEAMGKPLSEVYRTIDESTGNPCPDPASAVLTTAKSVNNVDPILLISRNGAETHIGNSAAPIKNKDGDITGAVIVFRDFTDFRERQKQIEYLSFRDPLTGLYNRRYMNDAIQRLDIRPNLPISVMVLDVNGLKLTNDAFGHIMGDNLLKAVASVITRSCRADDVIARMGGDEFFILLPRTDETGAEQIKKRILSLSQEVKLESIVLSIAIGVSVKNNIYEDIEHVIMNADNKMYREKFKHGKTMRNQTIETVLKNINYKYDKEKLHTERVALYCEAIATAMELSPKEITDIKMAASLHDIGKIMIPPKLLNKKGKLTAEEYEVIKKHPETGYQILKSVDEYAGLAEYVLCHHERWDGNGYPTGLKEKEIPLQARIISVADAYEAMTSKRSYQKTKTTKQAKRELIRCAGTQFDPEIVQIFIALI